MDVTRLRILRVIESGCWVLGIAGLLWWGAFHAGSATSTRHELARFAALQGVGVGAAGPDQSLWSVERVAAWRTALREPAPPPLAVLRIAKIGLEAPVLPGTDDRTLDRGVGHIDGTALPGMHGNVAIAGHRDGFFRGLKNIATGDLIEVVTVRQTATYRVERTWVVDPTDVSVLEPTSGPALTLVTCYPFYFIGSAPRRFIVRAVPASPVPSQVIAKSAQKWRE